MYTVIIPTMWRGRELEEMLPVIDRHNLVTEILIVDNDVANRTPWFVAGSWSKVRLLEQQSNIFVNQAWNLGVKEAKSDKVCLMSDDILFDENVFQYLSDKLPIDDGIVGCMNKHLFPHDGEGNKESTTSPYMHCVRVAGYHVEMPIAFGQLMFFNKATYKPIPNEIKIWFGDNWLYYTHMAQKLLPRALEDFSIVVTPFTTSHRFMTETNMWTEELNAWKAVLMSRIREMANG